MRCFALDFCRSLRRVIAALLIAGGGISVAQVPGGFDTAPFPGFALGSGKIVNLAVGSGTDFAEAIAIQPDGKIVLAGVCYNGANLDFCIARLHPDGSIDTSFVGPSGTGNGRFMFPVGASDDAAYAVSIQADNKIVLAGTCNSTDFCMVRLNSNGSFDTSFVGPSGIGNGKVVIPLGAPFANVNTLQILGDGRLVGGGSCSVAAIYSFCIVRLNPNGTLDTTFGGIGSV